MRLFSIFHCIYMYFLVFHQIDKIFYSSLFVCFAFLVWNKVFMLCFKGFILASSQETLYVCVTIIKCSMSWYDGMTLLLTV